MFMQEGVYYWEELKVKCQVGIVLLIFIHSGIL